VILTLNLERSLKFPSVGNPCVVLHAWRDLSREEVRALAELLYLHSSTLHAAFLPREVNGQFKDSKKVAKSRESVAKYFVTNVEWGVQLSLIENISEFATGFSIKVLYRVFTKLLQGGV